MPHSGSGFYHSLVLIYDIKILLADVVTILGTQDIVFGEVDVNTKSSRFSFLIIKNIIDIKSLVKGTY